MEHCLNIMGNFPMIGENAGFLVTQGNGQHVTRVIDSYEIIYVKSGTLGIFEEDVEYNVKAGQALLLLPGRKHGGTRTFDRNLSFFWLHFHDNPLSSPAFEHLFSLSQLIDVAKQEHFMELIRFYIRCRNDYGESQERLNLILLEILMSLFESESYALRQESTTALATKAMEYIKQNLQEELTTSKIANILNCNPDYLGRLYMKAFHKTITAEIQEQRINEACRLLIETPLNINQICMLCGHQDISHFRRIFKSQRGMSPKDYRQKYCIITP